MLQKNEPRQEEKAPGQVRALARALAILRELGREPGGLTLTELSHRVGLAPSTSHRLLTTLETHRFARLSPVDNRWRVGVETFSTGAAFARARDIVEISRPTLEKLRDRTGETSNLFFADLNEIVCMVQIESPHQMRALFTVGGRLPMHATAAGKVMLAFMREDVAARLVRGSGLPRLTERTIDSPDAMTAELKAIKGRGVALDNEEHAVGLRAAASPIFDEAGAVVAAVSLSGPTARLNAAAHAEAAAETLAAARAITSDFGGAPFKTPR
ncbi:MAG: IclR family transcriptional regulator [Pseudomonadota bacterium]